MIASAACLFSTHGVAFAKPDAKPNRATDSTPYTAANDSTKSVAHTVSKPCPNTTDAIANAVANAIALIEPHSGAAHAFADAQPHAPNMAGGRAPGDSQYQR